MPRSYTLTFPYHPDFGKQVIRANNARSAVRSFFEDAVDLKDVKVGMKVTVLVVPTGAALDRLYTYTVAVRKTFHLERMP